MKSLMGFLVKNKIFLIILVFIFLGYIRHFAFWSKDRVYIYGDTTIYALQLGALAKHLGTIFDIKDSILLWNPYYYAGGLPTLSQIDVGILYPPNMVIVLLAKLLGDPLLTIPFYNLSIFLHLAVGAFFIFKLLRDFFAVDEFSSLLGALLWTFTGFNVEFVAAGDLVMNIAYFPILAYLILNWKRAKTLISYLTFFVALGFNLLLGYTVVSLIIYAISISIFLIFEETLKIENLLRLVKHQLLGFFLVTLPIVAPLYFSAFVNFPYSVRSTLPLESLFYNSASPRNVLDSIIANNKLFSKSSLDIYLYFSLVGLITLFQANLGAIFKDKKNFLLFTLAILGLMLSLGKITFLPNLVYFLFPGVNLFRRLAIFSIVPGFIFCLLVSRTFRKAATNPVTTTLSSWFIKLLFVGLLVVHLVAVSGINIGILGIDVDHLYNSFLYALVISSLTLLILLHYGLLGKAARAILVVLLLTEFGTTIASRTAINSNVDPVSFFRENTLIKKLKELVQPMDRVDLSMTQHNYKTDYLELEQTGGYLSLGSSYSDEILRLLRDKSQDSQSLINLLGIKYRIDYFQPGKDNETPDNSIIEVTKDDIKNKSYYHNVSNRWELEPEGTKFIIRKNNDALPRVYLAENVIKENQGKEIIALLQKGNPREVYVDPENFRDVLLTSKGNVVVEEYKKNYLRARIDAPRDSYLANSVANYPGWKIKINKKPVKTIQTNWFMIGTYVPQGENIVEFYYVPYGLIAGFIYMAGAIFIWSILLFRSKTDKILK